MGFLAANTAASPRSVTFSIDSNEDGSQYVWCEFEDAGPGPAPPAMLLTPDPRRREWVCLEFASRKVLATSSTLRALVETLDKLYVSGYNSRITR